MNAQPRNYLLLLTVFLCGMTSVAVEMLASRLLAPFFGTSLYIWAILIGFVMMYLSIGYVIGGRVADRFPRPDVLYKIIAGAGVSLALLPFISHPVLAYSVEAFANISVGAFVGSLGGMIILFAVPVTLLATVSPFAIRLQMNSVSGSGNISGSIYALSTVGSILGTFIPVFFLVPTIGTARSFFTFALVLVILAGIGLLFSRPKGAILPFGLTFLVIGLLIFHTYSGLFSQIKDSPWSNARLIYETESAYNFIQVVQTTEDDTSHNNGLVLNEGRAIHSFFNRDHVLTGGEWDYFLVGNYVLPEWTTAKYKRVAMIGSGAGTVPKGFDLLYGPQVYVDAVEIDPAIVEVGRKYFATDEDQNSHVHVADGRYWLTTQPTQIKYDSICIDAYRQPYIPFHLTTKEWFQITKEHLASQGTVVLNAGRVRNDYELINVVANAMRAVFAHVYLLDVPNGSELGNTIVIATDAPNGVLNFKQNTALIGQYGIGLTLKPDQLRDLQTIASRSNSPLANLREWAQYNSATVFTDDHAPIENVVDNLITNYVMSSGTSGH